MSNQQAPQHYRTGLIILLRYYWRTQILCFFVADVVLISATIHGTCRYIVHVDMLPKHKTTTNTHTQHTHIRCTKHSADEYVKQFKSLNDIPRQNKTTHVMQRHDV